MSAVLSPASCCFNAAMICSSVCPFFGISNLLAFNFRGPRLPAYLYFPLVQLSGFGSELHHPQPPELWEIGKRVLLCGCYYATAGGVDSATHPPDSTGSACSFALPAGVGFYSDSSRR